MKYVTKTIYLKYLACAKDTWLQQHKPELREMFAPSDFDRGLMAKGNLVEEWARKLFPNGQMIEKSGEEAAAITKEELKKTNTIFQATFIDGNFLARCDVLKFNKESGLWDLIEIKGKNSLDESATEPDHIEDAAFQNIVIERTGLRVGKIFLLHLNKEYVRGDEIKVKELFTLDDITEKVRERIIRTIDDMKKAEEILFHPDEKAIICECIYSGRSSHCTTFKYSHPHVPDYSVHDISRIGNSKKKLESLVDSQIFDLNDIPDDFELSEIQKNQVIIHKRQTQKINYDGVREELKSLRFPLYFLDYETFPAAIPLFRGYKPYQHITFQFSLDVLHNYESEPIHHEFLHLDKTDPSARIIQELKKIIGPEGNIIVWHKSFEIGRNNELAILCPEEKDFLENINDRVYDLEKIFTKQLYLHPGFKGRTSIKKVQPTLAPSLTYEELEIREGGTASEAWYRMVYEKNSSDQKQKIANDLLKYCGRDTYAMYAVWKHLNELSTSPTITAQ
jgi:hypothetical protein